MTTFDCMMHRGRTEHIKAGQRCTRLDKQLASRQMPELCRKMQCSISTLVGDGESAAAAFEQKLHAGIMAPHTHAAAALHRQCNSAPHQPH